MKQLYGCKRCNKIGYTDPCLCSGGVYEVNLTSRNLIDNHVLDTERYFDVGDSNEKSSIGNDDVFDRIDRELSQLRAQSINHAMREDYLEDKIKSLEERTILFDSNECAMNDKIKELEEAISCIRARYNDRDNKIKSLEEFNKDFPLAMNQAVTEIDRLRNRVNKLEYKEKIQFEHESAGDFNIRLGAKSDQIILQAIKENNYDKLLNCVKFYASYMQEGNAARKLLKELGEIE